MSICNFCSNLSTTCSSLDDTVKDILEFIFINNELLIPEFSLICEKCIQKVHSAYYVKSTCIRNEDLIGSYESDSPGADKLIDVYLDKNNIKCDFFPKELKICRFCISVVSDSKFSSLEDVDVDMNVDLFKTHLPEVDLTVSNNPIVCKKCLEKLRNYVLFMNNCLSIKFKQTNFQIGNKVDVDNLKEVGQLIQNTDCVIDNNLTEEDIGIGFICKNDNLVIEESKQKIEYFQMEPKIGYDNYYSKEEMEISIYDIHDKDDSNAYEEYSNSALATESTLCNENRGSEQQISPQFPIPSKQMYNAINLNLEASPISLVNYTENKNSELVSCDERENVLEAIGRVKLKVLIQRENLEEIQEELENRFVSKAFHPVKEFANLNSKSKQLPFEHSTYQLQAYRNSAYQIIKINEEFMCGFCSFQSLLEIEVKNHFDSNHCPKNNCSILHENNPGKTREFVRTNGPSSQFTESSNKHSVTREGELIQKKTKLTKKPLTYKCEQCSFQTNYPTSYKRHEIVHRNPEDMKLFECSHCSFKTKHKGALKAHSKRHSDDFDGYKCEHCDYKAKYRTNLKSHSLMHTENSPIYQCKDCDFRTKRPKSLRRHQILHKKPEDNKLFKCEYCNYITTQKSYLKVHLAKHSVVCDTYKCVQCDFTTKQKRYLLRHVKIHCSEIMLECEHCDFKTKNKFTLARHLKIHSDEFFQYECQFCDFRTKHHNSYKQHQTSHQDPVEIVLFKCPYCDFEDKYKYTVNMHLREHISTVQNTSIS